MPVIDELIISNRAWYWCIIAVIIVMLDTAGMVDIVSDGDLASILQEVNQLRVQLERCISSNDRLRHTLHKCGSVTTLADDNYATSSSHQPSGKLIFSLWLVVWYFFVSVLSQYTWVVYCVEEMSRYQLLINCFLWAFCIVCADSGFRQSSYDKHHCSLHCNDS